MSSIFSTSEVKIDHLGPYTGNGIDVLLNGNLNYNNATAGTQTVIQSKLASDTDYQYYLAISGLQKWGPGGSTAQDTYFYRKQTNGMALGSSSSASDGTLFLGTLESDASGAGNTFIQAKLTANTTAPTFQLLASGSQAWAPTNTNAAADVYLYRGTTGTLYLGTTASNTNGNLEMNELSLNELNALGGNLITMGTNSGLNFSTQGVVGDILEESKLSSDTDYQYQRLSDGSQYWGPGGSTAQDTVLYRSAANTLTIGSSSSNQSGTLALESITTKNSAATTSIIANTVGSNVTASYDSDGQLGFGAIGGGSARDAYLYRDAANSLSLTTASRGGTGGNLNCLKINATNATAQNLTVNPASTDTFTGGAKYCTSLSGGGNSFNATQNSGCFASADCVTDAYSSTQGFYNAQIGCYLTQIGDNVTNAATENCVFLATNNSASLSAAMLGGCQACLATGLAFSMGPSQNNIVFLGDSASTFGGTTSFGHDNIFQCAFQSGYYFTSNAARSAGVSVIGAGTSWSSICDKRLKKIHSEKVLLSDEAYARYKNLSINSYQTHGILNPKADWEKKQVDTPDTQLDVGPTAQDFNHVFEDYFPSRTSILHTPGSEVFVLPTKDELAALYLVTQKQAALIDGLLEGIETLEAKIK
jgi:hypothetical protein